MENESFFVPVTTLCILTAIWTSYLMGLNEENQLNARFFTSTVVSPSNAQFFFMPVGFYPQCSDQRAQLWRFVTVQLVHHGFLHILGNTSVILIVGTAMECFSSSIVTFLLFESGILVGCLGHAYMMPYNPLVGCSHGVYAMIGGLLCGNAVELVHCNHSKRKYYNIIVLLCLTIQLLYDAVGME